MNGDSSERTSNDRSLFVSRLRDLSTKFPSGSLQASDLREAAQLLESSDETAAKPTDSELYSSSELFRHIWVCPMGWIGDKLIYGPGYTSADMKPWLVKLRRLVGFEHPEGTPSPQTQKGDL